jgi:uncharacterized protein (TIGR03067 family)
VLKLIPAPFPAERGDVFKRTGDRLPFQSADDCLMAVTVNDGKPESAHPFTNRHTPGADAPGKSLASFLEYGLRIDMTKLVDPAGLLASTVLDADVVLKKGAAPTDLIAALRKELKAKCGVDLVLEFREAETQVIVISGEHTLTPTPAETSDPRVIDGASVIHLYATDKQEHAGTLIANTTAFPRELAKFLGRPVIDQSDLGKNVVLVKTTFHLQHPATDKTRAADRDPARVLQNLGEQTGLTFKLEKRKVRALVVEKAKPEPAKPDRKADPANPDRTGGGDDKQSADAKKLLGKWVSKSVTFDPPFLVVPGETRTPAQHTLTFTDKELTWLKLVPGEPRSKWEMKAPYQLDQTATPKELTSDRHRCVYELDGDTLKVAMYVSSPGRPKGFTAKDDPTRQVMLIEFAREPAWKAEFRKAYGLADGQLVRRVAPPYPACREEYFKALLLNWTGNIPFDQWFAVLGWKGDWTQDGADNYSMPTKADEGVPLECLLDMTLKFPKTRLEADKTTLDRKVTGDFVVRAGAEPEKVAAQLEALLRKELDLPVKFTFKDAEEEVFVLSGKYAAKPLADRKADQIEVYAKELTDRTTGGGGTGTLAEMAAATERHVGKRIVLDKVEGEPAKVSWHYNGPSVATQQKPNDARNAPRVLANIAEQTGLTVTAEKRKARVLVVEHAEVKK